MSKWSAWPFAPIKDLSEIRQRHARYEAMSSLWDLNPYDMHRDREWLLAEVDRQHADNERLRAEIARMKKLHTPPADIPWPAREEDKP